MCPRRVLTSILRRASAVPGTGAGAATDEEEVDRERANLGLFGFAFELFFELKALCLTGFGHMDDAAFFATRLPEFPAWFYDHCVNWVSLSFVNGQRIVSNTVLADEVRPVTKAVSHSVSVIDVCRVLSEMWGFWEKLEPTTWRSVAGDDGADAAPLLDRAQMLNVHIARSMCDLVEFYAASILQKAEAQGHFVCGDGADQGAIQERVCVILNNLHEICVNLEPLERKLFDCMRTLKERAKAALGAEEGAAAAAAFHDAQIKTAELVFATTRQEVERRLDDLVDIVCTKVSDKLSSILTDTMLKFSAESYEDVTESQEQATELIATFLDYLEDNLAVIDRLCFDSVSLLAEKRLWVECLCSVKECLVPPAGAAAAHAPRRLAPEQRWLLAKWCFPEIVAFFHQGGEGLAWDDLTITNARQVRASGAEPEFLAVYFNVARICTLELSDSEYLVMGYLRKVAWLRPEEPGDLGALHVRVRVGTGADDTEHSVNVAVVAADGLSRDADPRKRKTYVVVSVHPRQATASAPVAKTGVAKGNQLAWGDEFSWTVMERLADCVVHFEVFDSETFSSDTPLGECCIWLGAGGLGEAGEDLHLPLTASVPSGPGSGGDGAVVANATTEVESAQNASAQDIFTMMVFNREKAVRDFVKKAHRLHERHRDMPTPQWREAPLIKR